MKEINEKQISKFEKKNSSNYKKAINNTLFSLENSDFFNIYKDSFEQHSNEFKIIDFDFNEQLTGIVNFEAFNTFSYLELLNPKKEVVNEVKRILKQTNDNLVFIFENMIGSISDAKQKIMFVEDFENQIDNYLINAYLKYTNIIKNQMANLFIPRILTYAIECIDKTWDLDLFTKKIDNLNYQLKNNVSNQTSIFLKEIFNEIYKSFGLNIKAKQTTSSSKKIPFSDFNEENQIFQANFDDEQTALRILGLNTQATKTQIKAAYKKMALKYHPDRNHSQFAIEQMKKINGAYNLLKKRFD